MISMFPAFAVERSNHHLHFDDVPKMGEGLSHRGFGNDLAS
jgi:hypothetical protein